ncbi:MAG: cyclic nucleotide-binding domain-containing protein [Chiayiivirga sp.]|jgi:CRP-like cAMP-binding protein|nr:cyclic nucleotide-binding domain-containing protein [Chiayiivirga sp.]
MSREGRSESPFSDFPAGATILRQGEPASALFIIEAGKVAIERSDAPGVVLAELGPGEFFGEMAILQEAPHSANVVARTVVRALRIDVASFHAVLRENAEVSVHLMRRLVQRLRAGEARRVELEAQLARGGGAAASAPAAAAPAARSAAPSSTVVIAPESRAAVAKGEAPKVEAAKPEPPKPEPPKPEPPVPAATKPEPAKPARAKAWVLRHADSVIEVPAGKSECLVGRPDPATGAIPEINLGPLDLARSLSRRHARLLVDATGVSLREEPGVANGTWVNGERVAAGATLALKSGDKLRFGAIELELGDA